MCGQGHICTHTDVLPAIMMLGIRSLAKGVHACSDDAVQPLGRTAGDYRPQKSRSDKQTHHIVVCCDERHSAQEYSVLTRSSSSPTGTLGMLNSLLAALHRRQGG